MIDKRIYSQEYIEEVLNSQKCDPTILERTIFAFGLLEALVTVVVMGVLRIVALLAGVENCQKLISIVSMSVNVIAVIFLMMAREPYAAVMAFVLLAIKIITVYLCNVTHGR